jgi:hypothetical protein
MENPPCFDLKDALLRWRRELAGQPGLSAEDVRELETHLWESLSAFQRCGLTEEEAFAKAREKLGSVPELGAEFAKANVLRIWRDRVFWIALLGFFLALYCSAFGQAVLRLAHSLRGSLGMSWAVLAVSVLLGGRYLFLCALMSSGYAELLYRKASWLFSRRRRLGLVGFLVAVAITRLADWPPQRSFVFVLGLLTFTILVMPREIRVASTVKARGLDDWRSSVGVWRDRLFWVLLAELAMGAWTIVTLAGACRLNPPGSPPAVRPLILAALFTLAWLGPMGIVGLGLRTGRLSAFSLALDSRWSAALVASALTMISVGTKFWLSTWNVSSAQFSAADWKADFTLDSLCSLFIGAVVVALAVWVVPWQRQSRLSR